MVTFAEKTIVDYRLSFADKGKKTFVFRFHYQLTNASLQFQFFVCSKQTEVAVFHQFHFPFAEFRKHGHGHGDMGS
jgi:hypothetical protein